MAAALTTTGASQARSATPPPEETAATMREVVDRFTGRHRFVGGDLEGKAREAAIEVVVEMNLIVRGMARKRLSETNRIASEIALDRKGDELTIRFDDHSHTAPITGPPLRAIATADGVKLLHRVEDGQLEQILQGEDGGRMNTFSLEPDGRMRLRVRVFSHRLPRDLRYQLTYEK